MLPDLALLFVGGDDFEAIADDIWKFAIVGTLLAMIQLLVYSALARRQGRAVILIWTALAVLVVGALAVSTAPSLVLVVVAIDGAPVPGPARRRTHRAAAGSCRCGAGREAGPAG